MITPDAQGGNTYLQMACRRLLGPPTLQAEGTARNDLILNQPIVVVRGFLGISDTDHRHNPRGDLLRRLSQPQSPQSLPQPQ
jgi:hypothetical protein